MSIETKSAPTRTFSDYEMSLKASREKVNLDYDRKEAERLWKKMTDLVIFILGKNGRTRECKDER